MENLFYFETDIGCGIRNGADEDSVTDELLEEVGSVHDIKVVREATEKDIGWVRAMGGYIPN